MIARCSEFHIPLETRKHHGKGKESPAPKGHHESTAMEKGCYRGPKRSRAKRQGLGLRFQKHQQAFHFNRTAMDVA